MTVLPRVQGSLRDRWRWGTSSHDGFEDGGDGEVMAHICPLAATGRLCKTSSAHWDGGIPYWWVHAAQSPGSFGGGEAELPRG